MSTRDIQAVVKALQEPTWKRWVVRDDAVQALRNQKIASHPLVLPVLLDKLRDRDDEMSVLVAAARALVPCVNYPEVSNLFERMLKDPSYELRVVAVEALTPYVSMNLSTGDALYGLARLEQDPNVIRALIRAFTPEATHRREILNWIIDKATNGFYIHREPAILALLHCLPRQAGLADVLDHLTIGDPDLRRVVKCKVKEARASAPTAC